MFGTLMTNVLIKRRLSNGLRIEPFDEKRLQICQYRLTPLELLYEEIKEGKRVRQIRYNFEDNDEPYTFQPYEYVVIRVKEHIVLPSGIVGRFIPESGLVEMGFSLTAGKLDPYYGNDGEQIRFGIQNVRARENKYSGMSPLAYLQLFDISGLPAELAELTRWDKLIRLIRHGDNLETSIDRLEEGLEELVKSDSIDLWE